MATQTLTPTALTQAMGGGFTLTNNLQTLTASTLTQAMGGGFTLTQSFPPIISRRSLSRRAGTRTARSSI